jgi:YegS/Rv2252/BmrU family lipid kinase
MISSTGKGIAFIVNPGAGKGLAARELLKMQGIPALRDAEFKVTTSRGDAARYAGELCHFDHIHTIVAVGGDGTVHEIVSSLMGSHCSLAIIPRGSGNGLSGHLRLPSDLERAIQLIVKGRSSHMDLIRVNGQICSNTAGFGFSAWVADQFGRDGQRGLLSYIRLGLTGFQTYRPLKCEIGDFTFQNLLSVELANSSQLGNGAWISPHSLTDDGHAELVLLRKPGFLSVPGIIYRTFTRRLNSSAFIQILKSEQGVIRSDFPAEWHVDGEYKGITDRLEFEVLPKALKVIH